MSESVKRALRTAAQTFVGSVVTLWGAAAVFSDKGQVDVAAAKQFAIAVISAGIATGLSFLMTLVYGTPTTTTTTPEVPK